MNRSNWLTIASLFIINNNMSQSKLKDAASLLFCNWESVVIATIVGYCLLCIVQPSLLKHDYSHSSRLFEASLLGLLYLVCQYGMCILHLSAGKEISLVFQTQINMGALQKLIWKGAVLSTLVYFSPNNFYANRTIACLLLYVIVSQSYVRICLRVLWKSLTSLRSQLMLDTFLANQMVSLAPLSVILCRVLCPSFTLIAQFAPILFRTFLSVIPGPAHSNQYVIMMTIGIAAMIWENTSLGTVLRLCFAAVSLIWELVMDYRWYDRFIVQKNYRIDLPLSWLIIGLIWNVLGKLLWTVVDLSDCHRIALEIIRRSFFNLLRIERQHNLNPLKAQAPKVNSKKE